jgi:SAM-dependent methyltransferase
MTREATRKKWDNAASAFDLMNGRGPEKRWAPFKREFFSAMQGRVLFLAVGTGLDIPFFPPGLEITGIDISPKMLERAEKRAAAYEGRLELHAMDVHELPFDAGSFDQVFTSCTFCSVPEPVAGLESVRRVLKPGGELRMFEHTGSRYFPFNMMMHMPPKRRRPRALGRSRFGSGALGHPSCCAPGAHVPGQMHHLPEARFGKGVGDQAGATTALAVDDDVAIAAFLELREPRRDLVMGNVDGSGDVTLFVFAWAADVENERRARTRSASEQIFGRDVRSGRALPPAAEQSCQQGQPQKTSHGLFSLMGEGPRAGAALVPGSVRRPSVRQPGARNQPLRAAGAATSVRRLRSLAPGSER